MIKFEEDPFNLAIREISTKKFQSSILKAVKFYEDGVYSKSIDTLKELLSKGDISDNDKQIVYLILSSSFYKLKDEDSMIGLIKTLDPTKISDRYILYRIYQLASLLFTERKNQEGISLVLNSVLPRKNIAFNQIQKESIFKVYSGNQYINYRGVNFELNKNIFVFSPASRVFGELFMYVVDRDTTLLEISKALGFGYYELKNANPLLDPFDVRKDQLVILPFRRIFPYERFEYGSVYINIVEKRLYYPVIIDGKEYIITFPIGIGTDDAQSPVGEFRITEKRKDPAWYPPESIRKEQPDLPKVFPPGPDNPLGTRAMRLGNTAYLMHGTNKEYGIGMRVSHGCIRMYNHDVEKLFEVIEIGTKVISNEIYLKKANGEVEIFDDESVKYLTNGYSKVFLTLFKTDMLGKSFSIKTF
ncbi:MAG: L,D-transpeptidase [Hydrogenothermaceae bacterium]|nr:L,D-transpeptidase [Hydrogenothermaceae bacterium]